MTTQLEQIRDQQQETWDRFSPGWKKWDDLVISWIAPVRDALIDAARLRPSSHLLDVASGTGEPGLSAAALFPEGRVTITDLAPKMLKVAEEKAGRCRSSTAASTPSRRDSGSCSSRTCWGPRASSRASRGRARA